MRHVMLYTYVPDVAERIQPHLEAHLQHIHGYHERGLLLMGGQLFGTATAHAMGVFTSREAAEEFVKDDPLVGNGIVVNWEIADFADVFE